MEILVYGENSVFLDWQKAESIDGISHYRIYKNDIIFKNVDSDTHQLIINDLDPTIEYSFLVKAVTNNGDVTCSTNLAKIILNESINKLNNELNTYI